MLPFRLRWAPLIFSAVADALQWIMTQQGVTWLVHYLDNFLMLGPSGSPECDNNMSTMITVCDEAGLLVKPSKTVSPTAVISFLGMELDSNKGVVRLPEDKLHDLKAQLWIWHNKRACKKCKLLSLLGLLNHACKVARAGRSFLRRLIDVSCHG